MSDFRLPDVGEGLTQADIVTWHVAVGDEVSVNDPLVDIETAKSIVELPSPFAGRVEELLVAEGDTVVVGAPIVRIGSADGGRAARERSERRIETTAAGVDTPERPKVLVGYGPAPRRRRERVGRADRTRPSGSVRALAKPPVRKLAKDLGIDLASVPCEGPVVTRDDVLRHAHRDEQSTTATPVTGVRRATAEAMTASATVPQATEWVTVDVTATRDLVERLRADRRFDGVHVTPTLIVAKAICLALRRTPDLHARWADERIEHPSAVGLGVAVATERGLLVPVAPQADQLSLPELGRTIDDLVATARAGRLQPAQMAGGTFSLTNVGVFGIDGGTPILPPGQTGILALGQVAQRPWVVDDDIVARWVTTLAVTFDHRVVDGAQASQFLADVAAIVQDPAVALAF